MRRTMWEHHERQLGQMAAKAMGMPLPVEVLDKPHKIRHDETPYHLVTVGQPRLIKDKRHAQ